MPALGQPGTPNSAWTDICSARARGLAIHLWVPYRDRLPGIFIGCLVPGAAVATSIREYVDCPCCRAGMAAEERGANYRAA